MKSRTLTCITAMRYAVFVLAGLLTIGCGTGAGNHDPLKLSTFSPPFIAH
jgi:hypothetical protein